jgi:hypothetical protein
LRLALGLRSRPEAVYSCSDRRFFSLGDLGGLIGLIDLLKLIELIDTLLSPKPERGRASPMGGKKICGWCGEDIVYELSTSLWSSREHGYYCVNDPNQQRCEHQPKPEKRESRHPK